MWSQILEYFVPMKKQYEIRLKETRNSTNVCQNIKYDLGDWRRKIEKDYGLILGGGVMALTNIQSEMEENSGCFFPFLGKIQIQYSLTLVERAIILQCSKDKGFILYQSSLVQRSSGHVLCNKDWFFRQSSALRTLYQFITLLKSKMVLIIL